MQAGGLQTPSKQAISYSGAHATFALYSLLEGRDEKYKNAIAKNHCVRIGLKSAIEVIETNNNQSLQGDH